MNNLVVNPDQRQEATTRQRQELYITPLVDVQSTPESVILRAEMAGVNKAGVEISVEEGNLILVANCISQRKNSSSLVGGPPFWSTRKGLRSGSNSR